MGNSLRLCVACLLPCGALDVVRVVHINGQMEEYSRVVTAGEILAANPGHVISRPSSQGGGSRRIFVVSAADELERGRIYFLIPAAGKPAVKKKRRRACGVKTATADRPLEKKAGSRRRESGRVAEWQPHLESILEDL